MSLIEIKNLTFGYDNGTDNIFDNVSFTLDTSWHTGLAGRNGRGKTTLMNLMLNKFEFSGKINADVNFEYFPFTVEDENTFALDLVTEISGCMDWQARRELGLLGFGEDSFYLPFSFLSKGQQTKVMLAALFLKENGFLLIDEPTNHLDTAGRLQLAKYLQTKSGYIIVSHDRVFLDSCTDHTLYIGRSDIMLQKCSFLQFWDNLQKQDKYEQDRNRILKKDIKRLEASFKQSESWSNKAEKGKHKNSDTEGMLDRGFMGHKAEKMMQSAKNIHARQMKAIEEKQSLLKNSEFSEDLKLTFLPLHSKGFYCENVSVSYPDKLLISNLSFDVRQGDRVLIKGANGTGKTSLFNCIAGLRIITAVQYTDKTDWLYLILHRTHLFLKVMCGIMPTETVWTGRCLVLYFVNLTSAVPFLKQICPHTVGGRRKRCWWHPALPQRHISICGMNH